MKSVTMSDIQSAPDRCHVPFALQRKGHLHVTTRFQARHLAGTLDATLVQLGYVAAARDADTLRYQARSGADGHWYTRFLPFRRTDDIAVTVHAHALDVTGPVPTLRALARQLAR